MEENTAPCIVIGGRTMLVKRICLQCNKGFKAESHIIKKGRGKYCSILCCNKSRQKQVECVCLQCNKAFSTRLSKTKNGGGKYCSTTCSSLSQKRQVECVCLQCNKAFSIIQSKADRDIGNKYCSIECCGEGKKRQIKRICLQCNKEFSTKPHIIKSGYGKYCSKKCTPRRCYIAEAFQDLSLREIPGMVYLLKFYDGNSIFYKIGITKHQLKKRWPSKYDYKIIKTLDMPIYSAWQIEQAVIKEFAAFQHEPTLLEDNGSTECFNTNLNINEVIKYMEEFICQ